MPALARSTPTPRVRYPGHAGPRVPGDRAAVLLDALVREALREIRDAGTARPLAASQAYTDAAKGRPCGTRSLGKMLADAQRAGVPLATALRVSAAFEAATLAIYDERPMGLAASLREETVAEGGANAAQMRAALSGDDTSLRLALEESMAHLIAQRQLVAALTRELAQRGIGPCA